VAAYLRLHRPRFGARLQYDIAFPDRLLACELPSMMLLTLVENSLKHGLGPLPEGGAILLSAESSGEALLVDVADTGAGMGAGGRRRPRAGQSPFAARAPLRRGGETHAVAQRAAGSSGLSPDSLDQDSERMSTTAQSRRSPPPDLRSLLLLAALFFLVLLGE